MKSVAGKWFARGFIVSAVGFIGILALIATAPAHAQNFEVRGLKGKSKQVVLRNNYTGEEWTVKKGDEIDGMKILHIGRESVTVSSVVEGGTIGVTEIPVKKESKIHRVRPELVQEEAP